MPCVWNPTLGAGSTVSSNFDRTGFQQDWNVIFPPDRLRELESRGMIGSVADDLKVFYTEAVTAHPGQTTATSGQLAGWFISETFALKILFAIRVACSESKDRRLKIVGSSLIVPSNQSGRRRQQFNQAVQKTIKTDVTYSLPFSPRLCY